MWILEEWYNISHIIFVGCASKIFVLVPNNRQHENFIMKNSWADKPDSHCVQYRYDICTNGTRCNFIGPHIPGTSGFTSTRIMTAIYYPVRIELVESSNVTATIYTAHINNR
jgi:hypothetical protein